jgi:hypothetical protein
MRYSYDDDRSPAPVCAYGQNWAIADGMSMTDSHSQICGHECCGNSSIQATHSSESQSAGIIVVALLLLFALHLSRLGMSRTSP